MEILNQFGINPLLLVAQVVNFVVLLFILKRFLYKPILKVLEERKKRIEQSLKNAEEIEKRLIEIAEREAESIRRSAKEGEKIIKEATDYAAQLIEEGTKEYERLIKKGVEDVKKMHEVEKELILREAKGGIAELVMLTFEKITGKVIRLDQKKIIEKEVRNIS